VSDKILIVDDEESSRALCKATLEQPGRDIILCENAEDALMEVGQDRFDVVVTDMVMPGISGLELLERIKAERSDTSVILMSGKGSISTAVRAIKLGAEDFIEKPIPDPEVLALAVKRALRARRLEQENKELRTEIKKLKGQPVLVGGEAFSQVLRLVERVAPLDTTVMITGETGTGKEVVARRIHHLSPRSAKPFVAINCGGLPHGLLESLLFGHERGAFTGAVKRTAGYFEKAHGGVILLDEIGDMPMDLQIKLLRVLQEKVIRRIGSETDIQVDCRVIAATHRDLHKMVNEGGFREDLYYRLNVINIFIPPLRDRREDISALAAHFIRLTAAKMNKRVRKLEPNTLKYLLNYEWPGNIRELQNVLERAVVLSASESINLDDLPAEVSHSETRTLSPLDFRSYNKAKIEFERQYIESALEANQYNVAAAAKSCGIPRQNFYLKMKKLGIKPPTTSHP
jgi:DNA-binding NtrC family response regulator